MTGAVVAEHTLTLDGVSESDDYRVHLLGSNSGIDERNAIINVLDTGRANDGVDELTVVGFDSDQNGNDGNGDNLPTDDLFLLRRARCCRSSARARWTGRRTSTARWRSPPCCRRGCRTCC